MGALRALWGFLTSKAGLILAAAAAIGLVVARLISIGYQKRKTEEVVENAKARDRMEDVPVPSTDDTIDRLRDGSF